ncbi:MAG: twin-arginine translocase TatA/TatE family subunit [Bacteroidales bacterium]|nr:twin-arginine translocase TatA/TatE family subunit [Bacteroidales bacterium]
MFNDMFLIFGLGTTEIILIVLVVLLLFGGKKIPELMRGVGKGVKSFKDGIQGMDDEIKDISKDKPTSEKKTPPTDPAG